jgi:hypothetical protein
MTLNITGSILNSSLSISALSPLKITKTDGKFMIHQNWQGSIVADGLSYQTLADTMFRLHKYVLKEGSKAEAKKAEDHGPIWQFGFMKDPVYVSFIRPMDMNLKLFLTNLKNNKYSLPDHMQFDVIKRGGTFRLDLNRINEPGINFDFLYSAEMDLSLPHHELKMNLSLDHNPFILSEAILIHSPPEKIKIAYSFGGDGIYAGDMVSRSWSSLLMEMQNADISKMEAVNIAKHVRQFSEGAFIAEIFSLQRSTEGPFINLGTIGLKTPQISARGSGQYLINSGGKMEFFYTLPLENNKSGKFTININEDESMTPEIN